MFDTHPGLPADFSGVLSKLVLCDQACLLCANACFGDRSGELHSCIQEALNCSDVCRTTTALLLRRVPGPAVLLRAQLEACIAACQACLNACSEHNATSRACGVCGEICRECEDACYVALTTLPPDFIGR